MVFQTENDFMRPSKTIRDCSRVCLLHNAITNNFLSSSEIIFLNGICTWRLLYLILAQMKSLF